MMKELFGFDGGDWFVFDGFFEIWLQFQSLKLTSSPC